MTRRTSSVDGQLSLPLLAVLPWSRRVDLARRIEPDWQDRAACANTTHPEIFFPNDPDSDPPVNCTRDADGLVSWPVDVDPAWLCTTCPVARSCLIVALLHDEHGIWGHTTEAERDELAIRLVAGNSDTDELLSSAVASTRTSSTSTTSTAAPIALREAS